MNSARFASALLCALGLLGAACSSADDSEGGETAGAIANAPPAWTTEAEVADVTRYESTVVAYAKKVLKRGSFISTHPKQHTTTQGPQVDIAYAIARAENEKGALVVLNGRTESFSQYSELVYDLHRRGYTLYMLDHRGQGNSSRLIDFKTVGDDEYVKGYVDDFQDYVDDFHTFMQTVVIPDRAGKAAGLVGLAHSTGGAVMTLHEEQFPGAFQGLVFSSPMFEVQAIPGSGFFAKVVDMFNPTGYIPGAGPKDSSFDDNKLTSSAPRFHAKFAVFQKDPAIRIAGTTYRWAAQALTGTQKLRDNAASIRVPMLILQGANDEIVDPDGHTKVCEKVRAATGDASRCTIAAMDGSRHEGLIEIDAVRKRELELIVSFADAHKTRSKSQ